jgi:hypothetical protein
MRSGATPSSRALFADLEEYVHDHRPHGPMTADATEPAWNGYLLTVACPCGVTFERWATPEEAELDPSGLRRETISGCEPAGPTASVMCWACDADRDTAASAVSLLRM